VGHPGWKEYVFEAFAEGTGDGEIYSVFLTKPASTASALPGSGFSYSTRVVFPSLSTMNSLYRSGTYRFDFDSENDFFGISYVSLTGDTYPPAPHVTNYTAAQAINPATNFVVQWDPFTGGTTDDTVELYVYDETDAVVYTDAGGLDGTARSDTIPANALGAGKTYSAEVIFWKSVDVVLDNSGAVGFSFYYKSTRFTIATAGSSGNNAAPTISVPVLQPGQFQFHIDGVAGRLYRIESTVDFGSWGPVETITAPAGGAIDYAHNAPPGLTRFYRAVLLP
jgi:hypothetical protein